MRERPPRAHMPLAVQRAVVARQNGVCGCGCGQAVSEKPKSNTEFDHMPSIRLREINREGDDYIPPQNDPDYIVARCPASHAAKTRGTGATTAGTDIGNIKKERRRGRPPKPKQKIPSRPFQRRSQ
jgi:hypothetical protein